MRLASNGFFFIEKPGIGDFLFLLLFISISLALFPAHFRNLKKSDLWRIIEAYTISNMNETYRPHQEKAKFDMAKQYDGRVSREYAAIAEHDPSKKFVQYPASLKMLGDIEGKDILEIGCGGGKFARIMARNGAHVAAYDRSKDQVAIAKEKENDEPLGIEYFTADRPPEELEGKFDAVTIIMVFPHAESPDNLAKIFGHAHQCLKPGGKMVALTSNPELRRIGEIIYRRRWTKREDGGFKVEFFDENGKLMFDVKDSHFTKAEFEEAAKKGGFKKIEWQPLCVTEEGKKEMGEEFWKGYEEDCPYVGIVANKE